MCYNVFPMHAMVSVNKTITEIYMDLWTEHFACTIELYPTVDK